MEASCLDRAYLPPILESRFRVARYIPTSSEHHAYLLGLETAGLALLPSLPSIASSSSLYWKFNSSFVNNSSFLPAFRAMWEPLAIGWPVVAPPETNQHPPAAPTPHIPTPPPPPLFRQLRNAQGPFRRSCPQGCPHPLPPLLQLPWSYRMPSDPCPMPAYHPGTAPPS